MKKSCINKFIGNNSISLVEAMGLIDENAKGILFITDEKFRLEGSLTDGDIRRWLLKTGDLQAKAASAMTTDTVFLMKQNQSQAFEIMKKKSITAVPIIDEERVIVDIIFSSDAGIVFDNEEEKDLSEIPVIIMAGGKGTRLYPFTKILPKPLIPIGETPIVERIIHCFTKYHINNYYMTVNYKKNMIKSYFTDLDPHYKIHYVEEDQPLGTAGSIRLIDDTFSKPIFVTNCDALILADYSDIYDYHVQSGNSITVVSALKNISVPYGVLHFKENGELLQMEEKPKLSYFINSGMYVINPEVIDLIPKGEMYHMTHLVEAVMKEGKKVGTYPISEDSFLDMGEFDEMHRMEEKLNLK